MPETTPIYDEIQKFMNAIQKEVPKVVSSFEKAMQAFEGWPVYIDWGQQYGKNQYMMGSEAANQAWFAAERKNQERKDRLKKERENCLHGHSPFRIFWAVSMKCPQCYNPQVYVGSEKLWCLLCGWKQWRIGKRRS